MEWLAEISRMTSRWTLVTEPLTEFRQFYDYKIKQLNTNGPEYAFRKTIEIEESHLGSLIENNQSESTSSEP